MVKQPWFTLGFIKHMGFLKRIDRYAVILSRRSRTTRARKFMETEEEASTTHGQAAGAFTARTLKKPPAEVGLEPDYGQNRLRLPCADFAFTV